MIINLVDGQHKDIGNTKELIFVLPKTIAICRNDEIGFGGRIEEDMMMTPAGQSTFFKIDMIKFLFPEKGRLKVWLGDIEVSNDLYYLSFLFSQVNHPASHAAIFAAEPFSEAGIPELSSLNTKYSWTSRREYEFQLLIDFCKKNDIDIDRRTINKITYVVLATNPALRELWTPEISLDNLFNAEGYMAEHGFNEETKIPSCLAKNTFKEAINECFGFSSKKLMKMICSSIYKIHQVKIDPLVISRAMSRYSKYDISAKDPNLLQKQNINKSMLDLGELTKGLFTVDHIYKILEDNTESFKSIGGYGFTMKTGRALLKMFPIETRMKLLKDLGQFSSFSKDTYTQYDKYKDWTNITEKAKKKGFCPIKIPSRWKNIKELHDNISRQYRDIDAAISNRDIEYTPEILELLDNIQVENLTIKIPKDTSDLAKWGKLMKNCIASMGDSAVKGNSIILGIYKDNFLTHNVQLNKNVTFSGSRPTYIVGEFRGISNKQSDEKEREIIENYLLSEDVILKVESTPKFTPNPQVDPQNPRAVPFEEQIGGREIQRALRQIARGAEND